jgi:hypothetical protein
MQQWDQQKMRTPPPDHEMVFLVAGYDEGEPYVRVFELTIPTKPKPVEKHAGEFGITWGLRNSRP